MFRGFHLRLKVVFLFLSVISYLNLIFQSVTEAQVYTFYAQFESNHLLKDVTFLKNSCQKMVCVIRHELKGLSESESLITLWNRTSFSQDNYPAKRCWRFELHFLLPAKDWTWCFGKTQKRGVHASFDDTLYKWITPKERVNCKQVITIAWMAEIVMPVTILVVVGWGWWWLRPLQVPSRCWSRRRLRKKTSIKNIGILMFMVKRDRRYY